MTEPQHPEAQPKNEPDPAVADAEDYDTWYAEVMKKTVDLPDVIEAGQFDFQFIVDTGDMGEGPTPFWDSFHWDGGTQADWMEDIGDVPYPSPGTSCPVDGWASWLNGKDVLLAYYCNDMGFEGSARIPGVAPTDDAKSWVGLGRAIVAAVGVLPT